MLHCEANCKCEWHCSIIDDYYNNIVDCLLKASNLCVPNIPVKCLKPYWSVELDKLKEASIDMHTLWRTCGCPRQGVINSARLTAKFDYKQAIKRAAVEFERVNANEIDSYFLNKDTKSFWKTWNSKFRESPNNSTFIDGQGDSFNIAKSFSDYFVNIYVDSSHDTNAVDEFNRLYKSHNTQVVASMPVVDVESIEKCINLLKCNKSAGHDGIFAEHLLNSHPSIVTHLKILFHLILSHAHVPASFGKGVVIPIIKDKHGALSSMENYRPITLSPIISKVFESFLLELYSKFLPSDHLQFGFKKSLGCSNAIFILRQVIDYFNSRRSNVYIASLDASKAFDRINHFKLFSTLCNKGVPIVFINVIIN